MKHIAKSGTFPKEGPAFISPVNYTIKCNTLGEQKEVHTEPW